MCGRRPLWLILACAVLFPVACSDGRGAGGNSAESGNPEIAGTLVLENGQPASFAKVYFVPKGFNPIQDTLSNQWVVITDSLGQFNLDSLSVGIGAIEVAHGTSGQRLILSNINLAQDQKVQVSGILRAPSSARIGVTGVSDGDTVWVMIPGTSIAQKVDVKYSSVFVDSIPMGKFDSIFLVQGQEKTIIANDLQIQSGQRLSIDVQPIQEHLEITLNTSNSGANLSDSLFGFPLLIRLDSSRVDFRFISPETPLRVWSVDSTKLIPFQIARWNLESQQAEVWVSLDTLLPMNSQHSLKFVWNESDAIQNTSTPFSRDHGIVAAWHFDEGNQSFIDAGENGYDGRPSMVSVDNGIAGKGLWFNGTSSYISIPGSVVGDFNFGMNDSMTISVWVNFHNPNTSRFIFGKGTYQYHFKYQHPARWLFEGIDEEVTPIRHWTYAPMDTLADINRWIMLTVVLKDTLAVVYQDDSLVGGSKVTSASPEPRYSNTTFEIGHRLFPDGYMDQVFWGVMDEMIVSNQPRSPQWIRLTYLNQRPEVYWP